MKRACITILSVAIGGLIPSSSLLSKGSNTDSTQPTPAHRLPALTQSQKLNFNASVSARFDDNVYLTETNETSDVIVSLAPGARYEFGHNSLLNGFASYELHLTKYLDESASQGNLSRFESGLSYSDGGLKLGGSANYSESNQNTRELAGLSNRTLYTTETFLVRGNAEYAVTPLIGAGTGVTYSWTDYDTNDLTGNKVFTLPMSVYFKATPKVDYSSGITYSTTKPDAGPGQAKDFFYNIGLRGEFTPKLNGSVSVGHRTRELKNGPNESTLGYEGSLNYELTPKTGLQATFSKGFNTSPLGSSQDTTSISISAVSSLSMQFNAAIGVSYQNVNYGPQFFSQSSNAPATSRADDYWEGNMKLDYLMNKSMNFSLGLTHRTNESNQLGQDFSNNIITLFSGFRF